MVNFKENYRFLRFQRGSNIFQGGGGGPIFSRAGGGGGVGSNYLFPIETHITWSKLTLTVPRKKCI